MRNALLVAPFACLALVALVAPEARAGKAPAKGGGSGLELDQDRSSPSGDPSPPDGAPREGRAASIDTAKVFVCLTRAGDHLRQVEGHVKAALADLGGFLGTITNDPRTVAEKAKAANAGMMIQVVLTSRGRGASTTGNTLVARCRFYQLVRLEDEGDEGDKGAAEAGKAAKGEARLVWRKVSTRTLLAKSRTVREYEDVRQGNRNRQQQQQRRRRLKPYDPTEDYKVEAAGLAAQLRGTLMSTFFKRKGGGLRRRGGKVFVGLTFTNGTSREVTAVTLAAPVRQSTGIGLISQPVTSNKKKGAKKPDGPELASGKTSVPPGGTKDLELKPGSLQRARFAMWERGWIRKVEFGKAASEEKEPDPKKVDPKAKKAGAGAKKNTG